ncbi:MAG: CYTH domain-containing protein [Sporolactobacillus sp.]|jgi:uncharacterized protein YjbK|nr:CYTH domain-containing protein [Sporolactobacillus sp.]MCI1882840.1 CYTH domain-containing protein [Sporolactobacillus sp.]
MPRETEIEFKNMLEEKEFDRLRVKFSVDNDTFFKQTNDYFDTPTHALRKRKTALRIRHVDGKHDFTLKQPHEGAVLETHQLLSDKESRDLIRFGVMPEGEVEQAIARLGVDVDQLVHLGSLTTQRACFPYKDGMLFLDSSTYLRHHDYELEFEAKDRSSGAAVFRTLLQACLIPRRPSKSKILRLYEASQEKEHSAKDDH